jgi:hypothetical protein
MVDRMCIISDSVKRVTTTKLFGMPSLDNTRQLTVYTNTVDTATTNVMCLPVPAPDTVKFEKVPKDLFGQCDRSIMTVYHERTLGTWSLSDSRGYLAVQSHGSYEVVVASSVADLDRIPPTFATLTPEVIQFLKTNYPDDFGVILCRLRTGSINYEPFAYSHALIGGKLFLPTKHYHRHDSDFVTGRSYNPSSVVHADWDHEVYTMMTEPRVSHNVGPKRLPKPRNEIEWSAMPLAYRIGADAHVKLFEVEGSDLPNQDLTFRVNEAWITA